MFVLYSRDLFYIIYSTLHTQNRAVRVLIRMTLSLYTILSLPILYGAGHMKGGSGGGYIWRKSRAIVLQ